MKILYLHGINNQGRNSAQIERAWTAHLNGAHGLDIKPVHVHAPYYGDALAGVAGMMSSERLRLQSTVSPLSRQRHRGFGWLPFYGRDADGELGGLPVNRVAPHWHFQFNRVLGFRSLFNLILGEIEAVTDLGDLGIEIARQADHYFSSPPTRDGILARVMHALKTHKPDVVIAHSLGSVVAIEAIRAAGVPVERLVTIGSPLGLRAIRAQMQKPYAKPREVGRWINIINPNDQVTLGRTLRGPWGTGVVDDRSNGWIINPHSLERYLKLGVVGREIRGVYA